MKYKSKEFYPLQEVRLKYQVTLKQVAADLGLSISHMSRIERKQSVAFIKHYIVEYYKNNFGYKE